MSHLGNDKGKYGIGVTPTSILHIYESTSSTGNSAGLTIEQASTGDAVLQFLLTGVERWMAGVDNSDSDKFKISASSDLGTSTLFSMTTAGVITLNSDLAVTEGGTGASTIAGARTNLRMVTPLNVNTSAVGNVGAGEDDLITYTVPGGTLGTDGDVLEFVASGTIANNVNAKRIRVYLGTDLLFDTGAAGIPISAAIDWEIDGRIIRTGATTQKAIVKLETNNSTLAVSCDYTTPTRTLANNQTLKLTGEAVNDNDISQELLLVKWIPGT